MGKRNVTIAICETRVGARTVRTLHVNDTRVAGADVGFCDVVESWSVDRALLLEAIGTKKDDE